MLRILCFLAALLLGSHALGLDPAYLPDDIVRAINSEDVFALPMGMTGSANAVNAVVHRDDLDLATPKLRILLVAHSSWGSRSVGTAQVWFYTAPEAHEYRERFVVSSVPQVLPGRPRVDKKVAYPPEGVAYGSTDLPELMYLWRWVGMHAPDLVVDVRPGTEQRRWFVPSATDLSMEGLAAALKPGTEGADTELAAALTRVAPCETGRIPAVRVTTARDGSPEFLPELLAALQKAGLQGPSPARRALQQRLDRSPIEVAEQLSRHYGHELEQVVYIPAVALLGRLRLGDLTDDDSHRKAIERILDPYFTGSRASKPENGSGLSGHLIFSEMAERTVGEKRRRYLELARQATDLAFDDAGGLGESMPYHSEMSDALFMGGPILAHVGHLTGDPRYFDACLQHIRFMRNLVLREDGLYRHSPLDEAAWGRGNGFPALGVALCLSWWPEDRADRAQLLEMLQTHLAALAKYQDPTGCWHQVIDSPQSYRELTCTCMILFAAARGVRNGWLDRDQFDPLLRRAWYAVRTRVSPDGRLVDVCTGTGKQRTLNDYYRRPAILGPDARGGAMALLAAVEMAEFERAAKDR